MMKRFKKYELVVVLSLIVVMMAGARLLYRPNVTEIANNTPETTSPTPTVTQTVNQNEEVGISGTPTIVLPTNFVDKDYPLWRFLPYVGRGFIIDRYTKPKTLVIKIKGIDKKIVEKDVKEWLVANGEASSSHKLVWDTTGQ